MRVTWSGIVLLLCRRNHPPCRVGRGCAACMSACEMAIFGFGKGKRVIQRARQGGVDCGRRATRGVVAAPSPEGPTWHPPNNAPTVSAHVYTVSGVFNSSASQDHLWSFAQTKLPINKYGNVGLGTISRRRDCSFIYIGTSILFTRSLPQLS